MICPRCGQPMDNICKVCRTVCENIYGGPLLETELPILSIKDIVRITNQQHPWHNDIAIIRDIKHKHYRIEIHGRNVWIPEHWVEKYDDYNI